MKHLGIVLLLLTACADGPQRDPAHPVVASEYPHTELAAPDNCPDWHDGEHAANYGNTTLPNFGCAHAHYLTQVLEDPNDYVVGKGAPGTADAERATSIFEAYRAPPQAVEAGEAGASLTGGN